MNQTTENIHFQNMAIMAIFIICLTWCSSVRSDTPTLTDNSKPFGLVFQAPGEFTNYKKTASRFWFSWNVGKRIEQLVDHNKDGLYFRFHNLVMTSPNLGSHLTPDYDYLTSEHPDWFIMTKDGRPAPNHYNKEYLHLDLGHDGYVDWIIRWLRQHGFKQDEFSGHLGLDYGIFFAHKNWATYQTHESYRVAWEYFLKRLSEEFRPQYKILLNVGSSDLPTFTRMIRWTDGVLQEDMCKPHHDSRYNPTKVLQEIKDRWLKGRWCVENGKIHAVRYRGTIKALKLSPVPGAPPRYISVGNQAMIIRDNNSIIGRITFSSENTNTLEKLAEVLQNYQIKASVVSPFPESNTANNLQGLTLKRIVEDTELNLKQAPREAFLFGYSAFLMAAGPKSYFILGDERHREYYYPEMDLELGHPQEEMKEIAPKIFKREFEYYVTLVNLSDNPYELAGYAVVLEPMRGALIKL